MRCLQQSANTKCNIGWEIISWIRYQPQGQYVSPFYIEFRLFTSSDGWR